MKLQGVLCRVQSALASLLDCFGRGNENMKVTDLLKLLDDPSVQAKVRQIAGGASGGTEVDSDSSGVQPGAVVDVSVYKTQIQELTRTCAEGERRLSEMQRERDAYQSRLATLEREAQDCQRKLAKAQTAYAQLVDDSDKLKRAYELEVKKGKSVTARLVSLEAETERFRKAFELYSRLPESLREGLRGYLHGEEPWKFVICGVQPNNLWGFWKYCKKEFAMGRKIAYRHDLRQLFDFFFDLLNAALDDKPKWVRVEPEVGTHFNSTEQSATEASAGTREVAETLWPGIAFASNRKIYDEMKALVVAK